MTNYIVVRKVGEDFAVATVQAEDGNEALGLTRAQTELDGHDGLLVSFTVHATSNGEPFFRREAELHAA